MEEIKFKENWISVDTSLPEPTKKVLIYYVIDKTGTVGTGFYWGKTKETDPCKGWTVVGVTHWSPLIEAP